MNPRPATGTEPNTLHWLYRPTGEPHWMVATWKGDGWNMLNGRIVRPEDPYLVWWNYSCPAAPPGSTEADHRRSAMLELRREIQTMLDEYTFDHCSYDGSTGVWETGHEMTAEHMETLDGVLEVIDRRIAAEFGPQATTTEGNKA